MKTYVLALKVREKTRKIRIKKQKEDARKAIEIAKKQSLENAKREEAKRKLEEEQKKKLEAELKAKREAEEQKKKSELFEKRCPAPRVPVDGKHVLKIRHALHEKANQRLNV